MKNSFFRFQEVESWTSSGHNLMRRDSYYAGKHSIDAFRLDTFLVIQSVVQNALCTLASHY